MTDGMGIFPQGAVASTHDEREGWEPGPWDTEPDRVAWRERDHHCLLRRGGSGAWCGYVGVPPGHPWHGQDYVNVDAGVHGGLTYSNHCAGDELSGVCHRPEPGEPDAVWWLGFDCFHWMDTAPAYPYMRNLGTYRTMEYAAGEVRRLLRQVIEAQS